MSFIKDEEKEKSSLWDWILLAVLVLGGLGFWWYYTGTKDDTLSGFETADSLFTTGQYEAALAKYKELQTSDYLEPKHDSLLYERIDTLYTLLGKSPD